MAASVNSASVSSRPTGARAMAEAVNRHPEAAAVLAAMALVAVFALSSGGVWLNAGNLQSVLHVTAILGIIACGEALVIGTGEIDISVGSISAVGAFVFLSTAEGLGVLPAVGLSLAAGIAVGAFNGYLTAYLKIPSLIATLGTLFIFRGLAVALSEGFPFSISSAVREELWFYRLFGSGTIFGYQNSLLWLIGIAAVVHVVVFATRFGNRLLATGGDRDSALSRGVRVDWIKLLAFAAAGALAAFAGLLDANKIGFADATTGRQLELEAIAAAVVGGCVLSGGRISIIGAVAGAFILSSIQSYLVVMSIAPQLYLIVLALLVLAAVLGDNRLRAWAARVR